MPIKVLHKNSKSKTEPFDCRNKEINHYLNKALNNDIGSTYLVISQPSSVVKY